MKTVIDTKDGIKTFAMFASARVIKKAVFLDRNKTKAVNLYTS